MKPLFLILLQPQFRHHYFHRSPLNPVPKHQVNIIFASLILLNATDQKCNIFLVPFLGTLNKAVMDLSKFYLTEPNSRHRRVHSEGREEDCPFLPPEIFQKLQVMEAQDNKK